MSRSNFFLFLVALCTLFSCNKVADTLSEERAQEVVESFATAYFNYDFKRASSYCDDESVRLFRFLASQLTQADIDKLNSKGAAEVSVDSIVNNDDGSYAIVSVENFLELDSIGGVSHIVESGTFRIPLINTLDTEGNEQWEVRMAYLPRNEKRSRD